uniref:Phosphoserine phosphatase n=1 Tax=Thermosporothrix sp. COM3 TaxID=2490863 RepID=A0A455SH01_9CHLR|nr:hydrolase [Thermosporothrix sp. COM3]
MTTTAIIFDLDATLIEDHEATQRAMTKVVAYACTQYRDLDPQKLQETAAATARELWDTGPAAAYSEAIGISAAEGMWGDFSGDDPDLQTLHQWVPTYRCEIWRRALAEQNKDDVQLAERLAALFCETRSTDYHIYAGAESMLERLRQSYRLALLTNGAPVLQWGKIRARDLEHYFDVIVVSGDLGIGKPDPEIFSHVLKQLAVSPEQAMMVGDSLKRDMVGAERSGIRGVWINSLHRQKDNVRIFAELQRVTELPSVLAN